MIFIRMHVVCVRFRFDTFKHVYSSNLGVKKLRVYVGFGFFVIFHEEK